MGNLYSRDSKPQTLEEITTPLVDEGEEISQASRMSTDDPKFSTKNSETKEPQTKRRKKRMEDMILKEEELLPEGFSNLEELKEIYKAQKEAKAKNLSEDFFECELTAFEGVEVTCIVVSSDDKYVLSSTTEGIISVFDVKTRNLVCYFEDEEQRSANCLAISEDNELIVAALGRDIKLFNFSTRKEIFCLKDANTADILSVIISNDREYFITGGSDCSIKIFEVLTQKEVHHFANVHNGPIYSMAFSSMDDFFVSASGDGSVKIFDFKTKEEMNSFETVHEGPIFAVAISYDDNYLITGSKDGSIKVFDLQSKEEPFHIKDAHQDEIHTIVVSKDDKYIFSGSKDLCINTTNLKTKQQIFQVEKNDKSLIAPVAISSDGNYIFSGSTNTSIVMFSIYDIQKREKYHLKYPIKNTIQSVAVSDDSRYITSISQSKDLCIKKFDLSTKTQINVAVSSFQGSIFSMAISPKNQHLAYGTTNSVQLYELDKMNLILEFFGHSDDVLAVTFSSDEKFIISGSNDCSIKVFNIDELKGVKKFKLESGVQSVCLSQDMKYLVAGLIDGTTVALNFNSNNEVFRSRSTIGGPVNSITISDDNDFIVSGHSTALIKVFNLETRQLVYKLYFDGEIKSIFLTKDHNYIVSCSTDNRVNAWDFDSGQEVYCYENPEINGVIDVQSISLSNDNQYLVMGLRNGKIKLMRINPKMEPYKLTEVPKNDNLEFMDLSKDVMCFVLVYRSGLLKMFDLRSKNQLAAVELGNIYGNIVMPNNGEYIVYGDKKDKKIKAFYLRTKKAIVITQLDKKDYLNNIAISKDSKFLVTIIGEKIKIYNLFNKKIEAKITITVPEAGGPIIISNSNKYLISGDTKGNIRIYNPKTPMNIFVNREDDLQMSTDRKLQASGNLKKFKILSRFKKQKKSQPDRDVYIFKEAHKSMVCSLAISSDDKYLIAGFIGSIKVFDMETKQEIHHFEQAHFGAINSVILSIDNRFIISGSNDHSVKVFDMHSKIKLQEIKTPGAVKQVLILEYNKQIFTRGLIFPTYCSSSLELNYICSKVPVGSLFAAGNDNFLTISWPKDAETQRRFLMCYREMYIHPHNWTVLHLLAIFNPSAIYEVPEYSQFQVPFLLDTYGRTPLHYLLAQKNRDYTIINIMLKYIIDYLQDSIRITAYEHQKICSSLSNCFLFILFKTSPSLAYDYLNLCYPKTSPQYNEVLPAFGESTQKYAYSNIPVMDSEVLDKLYKEDDDRVIFHTNLVCLDYDPRSDDMLNTTHVLSEIDQENIFKLPIIENLIDHLWDSTNIVMYITAIIFSALMILLSLYIGSGERDIFMEICVLLFTALFLISEIIQGMTLGLKYLKSIWNWVDSIQLVLILAFIITKFEIGGIFYLGEAWMVSIMIIIGYLRWLSYLRLFTPTRILIEIIIVVLYDMLGFITVIVSILIGFSLIFLEFSRSQNDSQGYGIHFYNTFKLLFATYDDTNYNISQIILSSVLLCVLNVVFLNLLIAIISDSYANVQQRRQLVDAHTRLDMIQEAMILMRTLNPKTETKKKYLIYRLPAKAEEENLENREWEDRLSKIVKALKQTKDEEQENINTEMKKVRDQVNQNIEQVIQFKTGTAGTEGQTGQIKNEASDDLNKEMKNLKYEVIQNVEHGSQLRDEMASFIGQLDQIKNEAKDKFQDDIKSIGEKISMNVENQVRSEMKDLKEKIENEVKENVRNEMKILGDQIGLIKDDIQGLKELVNLVLVNLNQVTAKSTSEIQ